MKTTSIEILLGTLLLFYIGSANSAKADTYQLLNVNRRNSPTEIAQVSPLYGCGNLTFHNGSVIHKSTLVMNGYRGAMRTSYWSVSNRQTVTVDQTMKLESSASGILIYGYNPVWAGTNRRAGNYSPDNFLFAIQPNGQYTAVTCDDKRDCSPVELYSCQ